ncbi:hypothetical protein CUR86_11680 [Salinicola acroporae]|uniref:Transposase n=1 Tax=Salinicola acroporae TaxID=1541440 RepID=A0ABT6I6B5_9GAMM|nr:hypothetical protein [Salinicola acroporae]
MADEALAWLKSIMSNLCNDVQPWRRPGAIDHAGPLALWAGLLLIGRSTLYAGLVSGVRKSHGLTGQVCETRTA